jgi:hypothetical protein
MRRLLKTLHAEWKRFKRGHPAGHYYSPIPDPDYVRKNRDRIFNRAKADLGGINIREQEQFALLNDLAIYYKEFPFAAELKPGLRFFYENDFFRQTDAVILFLLLRHLKPRRLIEVGSGFSSLLILDTNSHFLQNSIECTFIEPYPERLLKNIGEGAAKIDLKQQPVQEIPIDTFRQLQDGDILFIDSSHVAKAGSDVNYIFFEILPALNRGVYVHIHDIFYPFEYPEAWIMKGISWNENYLLRAFLQYNEAFPIILFNSFIRLFHQEWLQKNMPLILTDTGGSLWLRKDS